jgi:hypothetical protein
LFAGSALAVPVCTNDTVNHQYICHDTFGTFVGNVAATLPMPKFQGPGSLVQVEFYLDSHIDGSATLTNHNSTPEYYKVTLREYVTLRDPSNFLVAYTIPIFITPDIFPVVQPGAFSVPGNSAGTITGSDDAAAPGVTITGAAQLAQYVGPGNIDFVVGTLGNSIFEGTTSTDFTSSISTRGSVDVIYTYAIPEPATLFLIGSSLLALGFTRKIKAMSA